MLPEGFPWNLAGLVHVTESPVPLVCYSKASVRREAVCAVLIITVFHPTLKVAADPA
jgi:hypothetical protein